MKLLEKMGNMLLKGRNNMRYKQRYINTAEQNFYMNCIDCLRYGYRLASVPSCGEDEARRKTIWKQAIKDMTAS